MPASQSRLPLWYGDRGTHVDRKISPRAIECVANVEPIGNRELRLDERENEWVRNNLWVSNVDFNTLFGFKYLKLTGCIALNITCFLRSLCLSYRTLNLIKILGKNNQIPGSFLVNFLEEARTDYEMISTFSKHFFKILIRVPYESHTLRCVVLLFNEPLS